MKNIPFLCMLFMKQQALNKNILIMKFITLFLILSLFRLTANYSQVSLNLNMEETTIRQVLKEIEHQTEFTFIYDNTKINVNRKVSIELRDGSITETLDELFRGTEIAYKIIENQIPLGNRYEDAEFQQRVVTGVVTSSEDGQPLPGVNILVKGTSAGTITDMDGRYEISLVSENAILIFQFVGFLPEEVVVGDLATINVSLVTDIVQLSEIVVVGYGSIERKDVTGSVATLKEGDFNTGVVTTPEQMIQGRVAGVQITSNSGEPGAGANIRIRGVNSFRTNQNPLYVVDGVPLDMQSLTPGAGVANVGPNGNSFSNPLAFINPGDIASIDILKDASAAAIYGSRGANGVILITTRKGTEGAMHVAYSAYISQSKLPKKLDVLSSEDFLDYRIYELNIAENNFSHFGATTDWQDEVFRSAFSQSHNLSVTGGNSKGTYHASFGYQDQEGILLKSDLEKYSGRFNITQKAINDRLTLSANVSASNVKENRLPIGETTQHAGDLLINIVQANPTMPVYNEDGTYFQVGSTTEPNPIATIDYTDDITNTTRVLASFAPEIEIFKGLKYKTNVALDYSQSTRRGAMESFLYAAQADSGTATSGLKEIRNTIVENTLTWSKVFGDHTIGALAGFSYQDVLTRGEGMFAKGFNEDGIRYEYKLETARIREIYSYADEWEMQSYFGRLNYGLFGKYLATATFRRDGSSKFGENNKYGNFPSFSLAWRASEEEFIRNLNIFNVLKLRGGWGKTGNSEIGTGHSLYSLRSTASGRAILDGGNLTYGIVMEKTPNPDIQWETTVSYNLGIDFGFFRNNRLSGSVDVFSKRTDNMLTQVPTRGIAPTSTQLVNVPEGYVRNKGFELALTGVPVAKNDWFWELNFTLTRVTNVVKDLPVTRIQTGSASGQGMSGVTVQVITNDEPMNSFYGRKFLGFDDEGNATYVRNAAGNGDSLLLLGSPFPDFVWGLNSTLRYKAFELNFFVEAVRGGLIYNNTSNSIGTVGNLAQGHNVFYPTIESGEGRSNPTSFSDRFLEDGSFMRLSNITLSYNVPVEKITAISNLRIYATANNVLLITDYSGYDPDVNTNASSNGYNSIGIDNSSYPRARTFLLGLNVTF
jgi:iron complex outermembrane receptor protein